MSCAAKGCTNCRRFPIQNISFHVFPRNEMLQKEWLKALDIDNEHWVWTKNKLVCSEHFKQDDFFLTCGRRTLRHNSIPSIKLFHGASTSPTLSESTLLQQSSGSSLTDNADARIQHKEKRKLDLRITEDRYESWMKAIGRNTADKVSYDNVICSEHFRSKDFIWLGNKMHLKKFAVPSINIEPSSLLAKNNNFENKSVKAGNRDGTSMDISKIINIDDADPLEINVPNSLSLFGDSVDNIEFVIESEDEAEEGEIGTKDNPIVIHLTKSDEQGKQLVINEHISKLPVIDDIHSDVIDLDLDFSDVEEIKNEMKIEDAQIQMVPDKESEIKIVQDKKNISCDTKKPNILCYVPNCTVDEKEEDKLQWFKPPKDKNLRKMWDICIDHPYKRLSSEDVVCHQHFSEKDMIYSKVDNSVLLTKSLKDGAVPCINFHQECCVPHCNNKTGYMYNFPVLRTSNYELWLYMIKNQDLKKLKMKEVLRHRVCSKHFEPDCFEEGFVLKSTAAPTLFLPEHNVSQFSSKLQSQQRTFITNKNIQRLCCAYGNCTNNDLTGKRLFKFPQDPDRCIAWLKACSREGLISTPEETVKTMASGKLGVCEDHFYERYFESRDSLNSDAVPKTPVGLPTDNIRKSKAFSDASDITAGIFFINEEGKKAAVAKKLAVAMKNELSRRLFLYVCENITERRLHNHILLCIMPSAYTGICSYRNCATKVSADNPFFSFPIDPVRSEEWLRACGLMMSPSSRYQVLRNQRICSKHFGKHMFESKYKLKKDAVPISFKTGGTDSITNREVQKLMEKNSVKWDSSKIIYCAVSTCPNNYGLMPGKGRFPNPSEDRERFDIWLRLLDNAALKELSPEEIYEKYMVCLKHFEPHFYMKDGKVANLNKEAVPTKFLTADIQWFTTSDYYQTRLQKYLDKIDTRFDKAGCIVHKPEKPILHRGDSNTTCVLEEDGIRFPSTGHYIHAEKRLNSKRKLPYDIYKFFNAGYGLTSDIAVGENIKIHTAIIIDDDDECERRVLQQLLDKRKRY